MFYLFASLETLKPVGINVAKSSESFSKLVTSCTRPRMFSAHGVIFGRRSLSAVFLFIYGFFAIAKSNGNRVKRVLEERINPEDNLVDPDTTYNRRRTHMTLAQIEDEIRSLKPAERIELYKWLDHVVVADYRVETSFCSRLGVDREQKSPNLVNLKCSLDAFSLQF
jgi:hypothetical protein